MRRIPKNRVEQIFESLEELTVLDDPTSHHNVKSMRGNWAGHYRMRIAAYRAIFVLNADSENRSNQLLLISVVAVGSRGDAY